MIGSNQCETDSLLAPLPIFLLHDISFSHDSEACGEGEKLVPESTAAPRHRDWCIQKREENDITAEL